MLQTSLKHLSDTFSSFFLSVCERNIAPSFTLVICGCWQFNSTPACFTTSLGLTAAKACVCVCDAQRREHIQDVHHSNDFNLYFF